MAYSAERMGEALAVLAANDGNITQTARDTGIAASTIRRWRDSREKEGESDLMQEAAKSGERKKGELADRLEEIAWKMVESGLDDDEKLKGAALVSVSTTFGTIVDKMRLLREETTEITETRDGDYREQIRSRLDRLAPEQRN